MFSPIVPILPFIGLIYFITRFYVDSWILLSARKIEMDSFGKIIGRIISWISYSIGIISIILGNTFIAKSTYINGCILYILALTLIYMGNKLGKPLIN